MEFIIVTGYSGAGKSRAMTALEDLGYYCIDNIPPALIRPFAELCLDSGSLDKVAVVTDARGREFFQSLNKCLIALKGVVDDYKILFLEASDDVIITRYKETRRKHPLINEADGSIEKAVAMDIKMLSEVRDKADYIVDTSLITPAQLKERLNNLFTENALESLNILCMSFGFKYGPATEADIMFDVRCLPNPFYIDELRAKTGMDEPVRDYVMSFESSRELLKKVSDLMDFLIPLYRKEGKSQIVISFGCTGGKHRSVTFAQLLSEHLKSEKMNVTVYHRDINKRSI